MRIKIGIDIVEIKRFEKFIENKEFLEKVFHPSELKDSSLEHLAGIFAAKEAFFKALKVFPNWLAVEVINKKSGEPKINTNISGIADIDLSISHEKSYAIANVVLVKKGDG